MKHFSADFFREALHDAFSYDHYVAFDYETSGELPEYALQPWRVKQGKAWATSLAWTWRENGATNVGGSLFPTRLETARLIEFILDTKRIALGWNVQFDASWMIAFGFEKWVREIKFADAMLMWRHWEIEPEYEMTGPSKKSYSLKAAVPRFIPQHAGYEEGINYHGTDPEELKKLHDYNVMDNLFTLKLAGTFYAKLKPKQRQAFWIEQECIPMVALANLNGMMIDALAAQDLRGKLSNTADKMLAKLGPHGVTEKVIRSPKQLSELLFDKWNLPVIKKSRKPPFNPSTDREVLHELGFFDERAKDLRTYREALNLRTKFVDKPLEALRYNDDWMVHPLGRIFGTYTGRLTYSSKQGKNKDERQIGWAIHQEKNDEEFRSMLLAPPGYTILEADAAGQEFKWMAIAARDPTMLKLCLPGEDPHSFMTSQIYSDTDYRECQKNAKKEPFKTKRKMGKVANLSLQYRTSAPKLRSVGRVQYNIPMTDEEAKHVRNTYLKSYPHIPVYWEQQIAIVKQLGFAETFAGRRVQVTGDWSGGWGWQMGSTAINYKIQGTGADQKYLALMILRDYLPSIGGYFMLDLHDGIYMLIPDAMVDRAKVQIKKLLDNLPYTAAWGFTPPVPLNFDIKVGKSWGTLEEVQFN